MAPHKIKHFERDHPGQGFPYFQTVEKIRATALWQSIAQKLGVADSPDPVISQTIENSSTHFASRYADEPGFDLMDVVNAGRLEPAQLVYLDWMNFNSVDKMAFADLRAHFHEIWYPSSDDLLIYDDSLGWLILITHYGAIMHRKLA